MSSTWKSLMNNRTRPASFSNRLLRIISVDSLRKTSLLTNRQIMLLRSSNNNRISKILNLNLVSLTCLNTISYWRIALISTILATWMENKVPSANHNMFLKTTKTIPNGALGCRKSKAKLSEIYLPARSKRQKRTQLALLLPTWTF